MRASSAVATREEILANVCAIIQHFHFVLGKSRTFLYKVTGFGGEIWAKYPLLSGFRGRRWRRPVPLPDRTRPDSRSGPGETCSPGGASGAAELSSGEQGFVEIRRKGLPQDIRGRDAGRPQQSAEMILMNMGADCQIQMADPPLCQVLLHRQAAGGAVGANSLSSALPPSIRAVNTPPGLDGSGHSSKMASP